MSTSIKMILPLIFVLSWMSSCKQKVTNLPAEGSELYSGTVVKTVKTDNISEHGYITSIGVIVSDNEAKPSFKTGGIIHKTYVREGDQVKQGQLLATLLMDEIEAQLKQAEEGMYKAERDMRRVKNLYADSVATLEQLQNVTTAYELAKRTVEIVRFNKNHSEVRAPITGKIIKQIMKSGEITGPGTPVYAIMGVGKKDWKISVGLVDKDWAKVNKKDKVNIYMDAFPGQQFQGVVSEKSSLGGNASGTFDIEVSFISQPEQLAAGMTANIEIQTKNTQPYPVIPLDALIRTNGKMAEVFVVKDGKASKRTVTIANLMGDKVAVSSGLEGIEEVITTGAVYLEDGEKIKN